MTQQQWLSANPGKSISDYYDLYPIQTKTSIQSSNMSSLNSVVVNKTNIYVEFRKWKFFWGLTFDSQVEVQKVISKYNGQGWNVVQFDIMRPSMNIFRVLLILLVSVITLGFASYWTGCSFIFERSN